jgi:hypothetical protein
MRIGALLGITIAVAACAESPVAPARALNQSPTQSTSEWERIVVPFQASMFVSCANGGTGENVDLQGELEISTHTLEGADGSVQVRSMVRPSLVQGLGSVTGVTYRGHGLTIMNENSYPDGQLAGETFLNIVRIIGSGKGNNLHVHLVTHQRWDESGNPVHSVEINQMSCK